MILVLENHDYQGDWLHISLLYCLPFQNQKANLKKVFFPPLPFRHRTFNTIVIFFIHTVKLQTKRMWPAFVDIEWLLISEVYPILLGFTGVFGWIKHYTDVISVCNAGDCTLDFTELSMPCIFPRPASAYLSIKTLQERKSSNHPKSNIQNISQYKAANGEKQYPPVDC